MGAPSEDIALPPGSKRRTALEDPRRERTVSGKRSDVVIVLVIAENACECCGYGEVAPPHRRLRPLTIEGRIIAPRIVRALRVNVSDAIGAYSGELLASVARALDGHEQSKQPIWREDDVSTPFASLTPRQRQIMDLVLAGHPNKIIAADLGISQRTVENHRASIMKKTGAKSLPALVRLAMVAERSGHVSSTSQH